ncbi:MAG: hypothetical protein JTT11_09475 [Candidatus Brockarchaeota archaeon]|nr:hypothetical protein [Candidatus Brockarchaeota archaeon]
MPVITSHVIGTVAIFAFAATLTLYLYSVGSAESLAVTRGRLQTVSDYVAVRVVQVISMANASNTPSCIQSLIELPETIAGGSYWIALSDQGGYAVRGAMVLSPDVTTESLIPINSTSVNVRIVAQEGLAMDGVTVQSKVYGGTKSVVVWGRRIGNVIEVGLGRRA